MKDGFEEKRKRLVDHLWFLGVKDERIASAFRKVKRELFVPKEMEKLAYEDTALNIGMGQTISQPATIAKMLELLEAKQGMKVLEVGSGCGYVCALLSEIVGEKGKVCGVEFLKAFADESKKTIRSLGYKNVEIFQGDGSKGIAEKAPFDRIIVSAACPFVPKPLFDQIKEGGRIVAPVGDKYTQMLETVFKIKGNIVKNQYMEGFFVFVPLRGEFGFK